MAVSEVSAALVRERVGKAQELWYEGWFADAHGVCPHCATSIIENRGWWLPRFLGFYRDQCHACGWRAQHTRRDYWPDGSS